MNQNPLQSIDYKSFLSLAQEQQRNFFAGLVTELQLQANLAAELQQKVSALKVYAKGLEDKIVTINNQLVMLTHKLYGKSSERSKKGDPKPDTKPGGHSKPKKTKKGKKKKAQLPSERYPDAPLVEIDITFKELPACPCCSGQMTDSGMTEESEYIDVIPAQFKIIVQKRHKYRCGKCHGQIKTAPAPARITPGSSYSDEIIMDVALSKYCDLIPIERYSSIAGRGGLQDLPPNSLIGLTHKLAEFVEGANNKVRAEVMDSIVLHADETPHKMLEENDKKSWYLWGFSNKESSYFEIRDTRSGDVASEILAKSRCEYLASDVFAGYRKAVRESNVIREKTGRPLIKSVYCNAHVRRKYKEAKDFPEEAEYFIEQYKLIYQLEEEGSQGPPSLQEQKRQQMKPLFAKMKAEASSLLESYSSKSSIVGASNYFLKNYDELTLFLDNPLLPIDNNHQERLLRSPVVGRKTWHGTHSKRGARTAATLFTLVESCKLNKVNPRQYFKDLVKGLHQGEEAFTPKEFKAILAAATTEFL